MSTDNQNMSFFKNKKNIVVTLICLLIILGCVYFIQNDKLFKSRNISSTESIGQLVQPKKDVRLKDDTSYTWLKVDATELLADGDSIFTGNSSSALVKLKNGQEIFLAPNSLIKLKFDKDQMTIDIPYGAVKMDKVVSNVVINDCGQKYALAQGDDAVALDKSKKCGTTKVKTRSIATVNKIKASQAKVEVTLDPPVVVAPPPAPDPEVVHEAPVELPQPPPIVELTQPSVEKLALKYDLAKPTEPAVIKWEQVPSASGYVIELSDSPSFTEADQVNVVSNDFSLSDITKDKYFRVKGISQQPMSGSQVDPSNTDVANTQIQTTEGPYSAVGKVEVLYPKIKLKNQKIVKEYKAKHSKDYGSRASFDVAWSEVPSATEYVVEVSDAKTGAKIDRKVSRGPASTIQVPKTGNYNYKVSAINSEGRKISSSGVADVVYDRVYNMVAPLIKQGINEQFYFFQNAGAKYIRLLWNSAMSSESQNPIYRVEIATDSGFSNVTKSLKTKRQNLVLPGKIEAGQYFWRVRSEQGEQYSDWSNTESFKVTVGK